MRLNGEIIEKKSALGGDAPKRWRTALLLCIFLGGFGAHRFYAGKVKSGILMLAFSPLAGVVLNSAFIGLTTAMPALSLPEWARYIAGAMALLIMLVYFFHQVFVPFAFALPILWHIWWIVDIVRICAGKFTDKRGLPLKKS